MTILFTIFMFLVVLGTLVFVHELGHFLAAKACNIYCDRFSLGIPPRLFGFRWGETDYCVGALPIGGYVKMAGQEDAPQTDEEREEVYGHVPPDRWFNNKPVWQRTIVIVAGPLMNLVFGVVLFGVYVAMGSDTPEFFVTDRLGYVLPDSPAGEARLFKVTPGEEIDFQGEPDAIGWKTGDRILSVNGSSVTSIIADVRMEALLGKGEVLPVALSRTAADGTETVYRCLVEPKVLDDSGYAAFGVEPFSTAQVWYTFRGSAAEEAGLQRGDILARANGQTIDSDSFSKVIEGTPPGETIEVEILRDGQSIAGKLTPRTVGRIRIRDIVFEPPIHSLLHLSDEGPLTVVAENSADFRERTQLSKGDTVLSIDGGEATATLMRELAEKGDEGPYTVEILRKEKLFGLMGKGGRQELELTLDALLWGVTGYDPARPPKILDVSDDFAEQTGLQRYDVITKIDGQPASVALLRHLEETRVGESVPITVERPSLVLGTIQKEETFTTELPVSAVQQIGVVWDTKYIFYKVPAAEVIPEALRQSRMALKRMLQILGKLFTGGVSPKELAGPLGIADMTGSVARHGLARLLEWSAFLSINLCVVNLVPLPVLDGGQLVFLGIEAIRRKPVNRRVFEMVQQMGLLMIIALVLFVTYNDISRIITRFLPG